MKMQKNEYKVRFSHPFEDKNIEMSLPADISFADIAALLIEKGFIPSKKGGWQFIIDDKLCNRAYMLEDYLPYPVPEVTDIRIHGLLTILI